MIESMIPAQPPATLPTPQEKLDTFFSLFEPTLQLAEQLMKAKNNAQEIVLLLCARLDAAASCIAREDQPNRQSFTQLLINYSGYRDLMSSVSLGDLYYELGFHRWLAEGMIPKPGRLFRFSDLDDPIISLLDRSGIALTSEAAQHFFARIMRVLAANYRCRPGQPHRKPAIAKPKSITAKLEAKFKSSRNADLPRHIGEAVQPLLERETVAGLLYSGFRNNAVHGVKVKLEEAAFFRATQPYWEPMYSDYYRPFMTIRFPGPFLLELLRNCVRTLKRKMLATGKLPPDVHFHVFGPGMNDLEFLDQELLPKTTRVRFQLR